MSSLHMNCKYGVQWAPSHKTGLHSLPWSAFAGDAVYSQLALGFITTSQSSFLRFHFHWSYHSLLCLLNRLLLMCPKPLSQTLLLHCFHISGKNCVRTTTRCLWNPMSAPPPPPPIPEDFSLIIRIQWIYPCFTFSTLCLAANGLPLKSKSNHDILMPRPSRASHGCGWSVK